MAAAVAAAYTDAVPVLATVGAKYAAAALEVSYDAVIAYQTSMHCMLFCRNADSLTLVGSLQALPIFLDKLLSPLLSVVLSVTAVLLVGKSCCCSCLYTCTLHHI